MVFQTETSQESLFEWTDYQTMYFFMISDIFLFVFSLESPFLLSFLISTDLLQICANNKKQSRFISHYNNCFIFSF